MSAPKKQKVTEENESSTEFAKKNTNKSIHNFAENSKRKNHIETERNDMIDLKTANSLIASTLKFSLIDYINPSIWIRGYADPQNIEKKQNCYKVNRVRIQDDHYTTFIKAIRESEWECVFNSLTTRFSFTLLAPTIIIRCIIHFILTTNDTDLFEKAIAAVSSYFQTHKSSLQYKKRYYEKLLLEPENAEDCPEIVGGKLFNSILDELLSALLRDKNDTKKSHISYTELNCSEDSSDEEADSSLTSTRKDHLERTMIVFGLLLDLLETDFIEFLVIYRKEPKKSILKKSRKPLIVKIDSPDLKRLLEALNVCDNKEHLEKIIRYISLLAEVSRVRDLAEEKREGAANVLKYPHFRKHCIQFATILAQFFISSKYQLKKAVQMLELFNPWLQMYVYSQWITERIGIAANPSLTFVVHLLKICLKETQETAKPVQALLNLNEMQKKLLSKHKITSKSVHRKNPTGETKLIEMCRKKKFDIVTSILSLPDVNVNAVCNSGYSALHEVVLSGNIDAVCMLLQYNPTVPDLKPVNVFISNSIGETALHTAAWIGHLGICKLLVQKGGAKLIEMEAKNGKKPIDYTKSNEVREYFLETLNKTTAKSLLKRKVFLDLSVFDLVLLRELSFAFINVYSLHEIFTQCLENSQKTDIADNKTYSSDIKLKPDYKFINNNIKALRELELILKCLVRQQSHPELSRPLNDWLDCIRSKHEK